MLENYMKTAIRNFWRQKTYSMINIGGLSVGLACSFLIFTWITHELSYDQFQVEGAQIHRLMRNYHGEQKTTTLTGMPVPIAAELQNRYKRSS